MNFPKLVYKSASLYVVVNDEDELGAKLAEGWFETVPEALAPKDPSRTSVDAPPSRAELEQKASELGIELDGRLGDKKLAALIAERIAA